MTFDLKAAGVAGSAELYDIWAKKDLGEHKGMYTTSVVPPHGVILLRAR